MLYQIINGGSNRQAIAMALPVEVVQNRTEAERVERAVQAWLVGSHTFKVGGVPTAHKIKNR
jgi:hypothetical protein